MTTIPAVIQVGAKKMYYERTVSYEGADKPPVSEWRLVKITENGVTIWGEEEAA